MSKRIQQDFRPAFHRPRQEYRPQQANSPYEASVWFLNTFSGNKVVLRDGENVQNLIRRFKKLTEQSGVLREIRKREYHLTDSQKRRDKKKKALKRIRKTAKESSYDDLDPKLQLGSEQTGQPQGYYANQPRR